ncbi:tyrosine-type recombinase/integrase [Parasutterella excrementihominis]|uniref:tyrosine-type recombinase/integrase n=1 Tax=Parasutterella excrementihominis TaxID=487175 RepID=UPI00265DBC77|nr:tyrosine-type recombinase/integrase [Parasutterella excrementihominis]
MFQPAPIQKPNFGAMTADQNLIENPALMYLATLGSKDSYRCMKSKLNKFARFFGYQGLVDCDWKSMQPNHITIFLTAQSWGSARTYNCYLSAIKSVVLNAWRNKQIDLDQFQRIKSLKQRRIFRAPSGRAISPEESSSLIRSLNKNSLRTIRNRAIFFLMLGCGLRRAEVCDLKLKQVSIKNKSAKIIGKGNKERTIYFPTAVLEVLKNWLDARSLNKEEIDAGFVFGRIDNRQRLHLDIPLDPSSITRIVEKLVSETDNLEGRLTPHDLRRTFATRLISKNVDIVEVQKLMGHASVATTGNYVRKDEENLRKAAEKAEL